jgi:hypothetical protein
LTGVALTVAPSVPSVDLWTTRAQQNPNAIRSGDFLITSDARAAADFSPSSTLP